MKANSAPADGGGVSANFCLRWNDLQKGRLSGLCQLKLSFCSEKCSIQRVWWPTLCLLTQEEFVFRHCLFHF